MSSHIKIVVAPQAFKGTASASLVANAIINALTKAVPNAVVIPTPIADGGGGTVEALVTSSNGRLVNSETLDPIGRPIEATWGILGDGTTAVIESAAASGLALLKPSEYNPELTSTKGTGLLIKEVLDKGYKNLLIGLGDSATNDGGVGLGRALGIIPINDTGNEIPEGGAALSTLHSFDTSNVHPSLAELKITVLCDVKNTLCGPNGSSHIFGPQKGASPEQISKLDLALAHFAQVVKTQFHKDVINMPGAGAGGGLGAGLVALCNATLKPGFDVISKSIKLPKIIKEADVVITGEGRIDESAPGGKGVAGIAQIAKSNGVKSVLAIVGSSDLEPNKYKDIGIDGVFALNQSKEDPIPSPERTPSLIEKTTTLAIKALITNERNVTRDR